MEAGPPADRRAMSRSRVSSPSAAKTGAAAPSPLARVAVLRALGNMRLDRLHLPRPALLVAAVGLIAALGRQRVEPRLDDRELGPLSRRAQREDDERRRLGRAIRRAIDAVGTPARGSQRLG